RDKVVTGVQTCALPISWKRSVSAANRAGLDRLAGPPALQVCRQPPGRGVAAWWVLVEALETDRFQVAVHLGIELPWPRRLLLQRSEERRVGKECRSRWV